VSRSVSLRLRIALWYGGLTGLVIVLVCLLAYAIHSRAHYDELDGTLTSAAEHVADEYLLTATPAERATRMAASISVGLVIRVYGSSGEVVAESPGAAELPKVDPAAVLATPSGPAFDWIARLAPPFAPESQRHGAFGLIETQPGVRWRLHVLPVPELSQTVVVAASLERLDASMARFRQLMSLIAAISSLVTFAVSWLLAAGALRPVAVMTATAGAIARTRSFSRRLPPGPRQDELGELSRTFNEMLDSLEQAYRAEQRFVGDASHELRAPLTAIQANLDLLQRRRDMADEERALAVAEASREADRLAKLVADLLALARADAGVTIRRERVELDRVLLEVLSAARHLTHGQQLGVSELVPSSVEGDEDRLKQLLVILLDNAIKYTPADGTVSVGLTRNGSHAVVTVADTGVGIPADQIPRVFERFYRADPARARDPGGSGLGLAIARWIVQQHGGEITVASELGQGTTVSVRLPAPS
jgi:two-component system, OmpR family, sensor kinase